ncbi:MAG TPA: hypothetical protein VFD04_10310 [Actinomycetes bacterium]|nr:hypothetical protein [Actinomycetes bacterium]
MSRARVLASVAAALAGCLLGVVPGVPSAAEQARVALTIRDPRITESSGLAVSRLHPGVLWTHNDSGDSARLFAVGPDGRVLATLRLAGVAARDFEAVAAGRDGAGRPALFVGDIGDNRATQPEVSVYRVTEPVTLRDATVPATRFRLRYPGGPRDAEALLVDPRGNRLYVASKQAAGGGLYRAPAVLRADRVNQLRRVAGAPPIVTDGAFSPDGRAFVLRDYLTAYLYAAPGRRIATVALPLQPQGESVAWSPDGRELLVGSEGSPSQVWRVRVPAVEGSGEPGTGAPENRGSRPDAPAAAEPRSWRGIALVVAALAAGLVLLAGVARARRR